MRLRNLLNCLYHCASSFKSTKVKAFLQKNITYQMYGNDPIKLAKSSEMGWDNLLTKSIAKPEDILIDIYIY